MPSLLEALERKYGSKIDSANPSIDDLPVAIFVPKRSPRLSIPTLLVLNDCDIDCAGDSTALANKCADVVELDIANNKLTDWEEVFVLLEQTPRIRFLNLSFNRLSAQIQAAQALRPRWDNLSNLVLNSTYIGWPEVYTLLKVLPALDELHLSLNDYSYVNLSGKEVKDVVPCEACARLNVPYPEGPVHERLSKLHFSGHPIGSWHEISKLGIAFPNLESLHLNDCPIVTLEPDPCAKCADGNGNRKSHDNFQRLRFLNLTNAGLETWKEIDRLALFPILSSLRVQGWPLWDLFESTEHERRQLLVARLPQVMTLNGGGAVLPAEREAAERAFIRYYMVKPEEERPERYWELVRVHGKLDPLVSIVSPPPRRVRIAVSCDNARELRTVDVYSTVSELKSQLERLAGFPASKMRLFYAKKGLLHTQGPEEMKFPTKQLYSYNIKSGDEIVIVPKLKQSISTNSNP